MQRIDVDQTGEDGYGVIDFRKYFAPASRAAAAAARADDVDSDEEMDHVMPARGDATARSLESAIRMREDPLDAIISKYANGDSQMSALGLDSARDPAQPDAAAQKKKKKAKKGTTYNPEDDYDYDDDFIDDEELMYAGEIADFQKEEARKVLPVHEGFYIVRGGIQMKTQTETGTDAAAHSSATAANSKQGENGKEKSKIVSKHEWLTQYEKTLASKKKTKKSALAAPAASGAPEKTKTVESQSKSTSKSPAAEILSGSASPISKSKLVKSKSKVTGGSSAPSSTKNNKGGSATKAQPAIWSGDGAACGTGGTGSASLLDPFSSATLDRSLVEDSSSQLPQTSKATVLRTPELDECLENIRCTVLRLFEENNTSRKPKLDHPEMLTLLDTFFMEAVKSKLATAPTTEKCKKERLFPIHDHLWGIISILLRCQREKLEGIGFELFWEAKVEEAQKRLNEKVDTLASEMAAIRAAAGNEIDHDQEGSSEYEDDAADVSNEQQRDVPQNETDEGTAGTDVARSASIKPPVVLRVDGSQDDDFEEQTPLRTRSVPEEQDSVNGPPAASAGARKRKRPKRVAGGEGPNENALLPLTWDRAMDAKIYGIYSSLHAEFRAKAQVKPQTATRKFRARLESYFAKVHAKCFQGFDVKVQDLLDAYKREYDIVSEQDRKRREMEKELRKEQRERKEEERRLAEQAKADAGEAVGSGKGAEVTAVASGSVSVAAKQAPARSSAETSPGMRSSAFAQILSGGVSGSSAGVPAALPKKVKKQKTTALSASDVVSNANAQQSLHAKANVDSGKAEPTNKVRKIVAPVDSLNSGAAPTSIKEGSADVVSPKAPKKRKVVGSQGAINEVPMDMERSVSMSPAMAKDQVVQALNDFRAHGSEQNGTVSILSSPLKESMAVAVVASPIALPVGLLVSPSCLKGVTFLLVGSFPELTENIKARIRSLDGRCPPKFSSVITHGLVGAQKKSNATESGVHKKMKLLEEKNIPLVHGLEGLFKMIGQRSIGCADARRVDGSAYEQIDTSGLPTHPRSAESRADAKLPIFKVQPSHAPLPELTTIHAAQATLVSSAPRDKLPKAFDGSPVVLD
ncbi:hypothetical protein FVE85_0599 [Porphyridium purpureum]|uniref:Hpc2-related domain-containing protein n=1 Tax=Porphyridium purpureum TaxID=35688 RepID=A0A5J4Z0T2_PORPP|nr:hypothetical protein FVE85_0599 [Porphyridium purpureum]|eukprot:POR6828..scf208_2